MVSILGLLKIFSEIIVASKCGPLEGLKNELIHKNWTYWKASPKLRKAFHNKKRFTIKDQKSNCGILLDLWEKTLQNKKKLCEWSTIKYVTVDNGVTMDLHKKFLIELAESCPHWLKITLWKKLGCLV